MIPLLGFMLLALAGTSNADQTCSLDFNANVTNATYSYGTATPFFKLAKSISDSLQGTLSNDSLADIYHYAVPSSSNQEVTLTDVVNDVLSTQVGPIIFFSVAVAITIFSIVFGCCTCCCRCCCGSCGVKKDQVDASKCWLFLDVFFLIVSFALIATGVVLFNQGASAVFDTIDHATNYTGKVIGDAKDVLQAGTSQVSCAATDTVTDTFDQVYAGMDAYPGAVFGYFYNVTGIEQFNNTDFAILLQNATDDLSEGTALSQNLGCSPDTQKNLNTVIVDLQGLIQALNDTYMNQNSIVDQVNQAVSQSEGAMTKSFVEAEKQMNQANQQINDVLLSVNKTIGQLINEIDHVQNGIANFQHDVEDFSGYGWIKAGFRITSIVPCVIALVFILLTALAAIIKLFVRDDPGKRSFVSSAMGDISMIGFYLMIFTCWIILAWFVVMFVGGWVLSAACKPTFQDPTFQLFGVIPNFKVKSFNGTEVLIGPQEAMKQCAAGSTVFNTVHGDQLLNVNAIMDAIDLNSTIDAINNAIITTNINIPPFQFDVFQNLADKFSSDIAALNKTWADSGRAACGTAPGDVDAYILNLSQLSDDLAVALIPISQLAQLSENTTAALVNLTKVSNDILYGVEGNVTASLQYFVDQLATTLFPCTPLYTVYLNAGGLICDQFGYGVQGMWAAAAIAGIFILIGCITILCTSRWLFRTNSRFLAKNNKRNVVPVSATAHDDWGEQPMVLRPVVTSSSGAPYSSGYANSSFVPSPATHSGQITDISQRPGAYPVYPSLNDANSQSYARGLRRDQSWE